MSVKSLICEVMNLAIRVRSSIARRIGRVAPWNGGYCVCCGKSIPFFLTFPQAYRSPRTVADELDMIGSCLDRYACPKCESNDRERHLVLYFETLKINNLLGGAKILHFAPEKNFGAYVSSFVPQKIIRADLFPTRNDIQRVDMLEMDFPAESFDFVIANHVLEHVADDVKALSEIHRVLRHGGLAILQTPYSSMLKNTFEDAGIVSDAARIFAYGQADHQRLYGQDVFLRFAAAGFHSKVVLHEIVLKDIDSKKYGINPREPLFLFEKI